MPAWLIVTVAVLVLVVGASWPTVAGVRRHRNQAVRAALTGIRARVQALDYRIDTLTGDDERAEKAAALRDNAQAILSVADDRRSMRACREAEAVTARAEKVLAE